MSVKVIFTTPPNDFSLLKQITTWSLGFENEFGIDNRFYQIGFKLNLIQQNAQLFVQILQNQKAYFAEWIIIVLIAFECILMILEMSGVGETLFSQLSIGEKSDSKPS